MPLAALPDLDPELHNAQAFLIERPEADGLPAARTAQRRQRAELKEEVLPWTRN